VFAECAWPCARSSPALVLLKLLPEVGRVSLLHVLFDLQKHGVCPPVTFEQHDVVAYAHPSSADYNPIRRMFDWLHVLEFELTHGRAPGGCGSSKSAEGVWRRQCPADESLFEPPAFLAQHLSFHR
jgi:hypothetical protein